MARKARHSAACITGVVVVPVAMFFVDMACGVVGFPWPMLTQRSMSMSTSTLSMVKTNADVGGNDLKNLLSTSDYSLDVSAANKGKVVKTAVTVETPAIPETTTTAVVDSHPPVDVAVTTTIPETPPPVLPEPTTTAATMKTAVIQSKTSVLSDGLSAPPDLADIMSKPFTGLNSFFKSAQDSIKASQEVGSSTGAIKSSPRMADYVAQKVVERKSELGLVTDSISTSGGTAKPLALYLKDLVSGGDPDMASASSAALAESKAKLDVLFQNLGELAKNLSSQVPVEGGGAAVAGGNVAPFKFWQDASNSLDQLPEGSKPWIAVGLGVLLLASGTGNKKDGAIIAASSALQSSSAKLEDLTDDLEALQTRMKAMEANGISLSDDLKAAHEKLMQKELEISKERLKALDAALTLNRQIEVLQQKLKENDSKVQTLDKELVETKGECKNLSAELIKAKEEQAAVAEAKEKAKVAKTAAPKKTPAKKTKGATKKAAAAKVTATATSVYFAEPETPALVKEEELPSATTSEPVQSKAKVKTKVKVKKAVAKEAAPKIETATPAPTKSGQGEEDWVTLSKSTLSRKTVKELQGYLNSKGITTTDSEGKPLKKAILVEAVLSQ